MTSKHLAFKNRDIFWAAKNGDFSLLFMLMTLNTHGKHYTEFRDDDKKASLLHWACFFGHIECVALLLHKFEYLKQKCNISFEHNETIFQHSNLLFTQTANNKAIEEINPSK